MGSMSILNILNLLDTGEFSDFRMTGIRVSLFESLKQVVTQERTHLKQIIVSNSILEADRTQANNIASVTQHIQRIIFCESQVDVLPLKSLMNKFESLDYIMFDACVFNKSAIVGPIDMSSTDIKSMQFNNLRKMEHKIM